MPISLKIRNPAIYWMLAMAASAGGVIAQAQEYPARAIRIVVPFAPGGGTDVFARVMGQRLQEALGQSVIVDNRAGAGSNIGTELVAKSPPDGHTLMLTTSAVAVNVTLYPRLAVDARKDLLAITQLGSTSSVLTVHPSVPVRTVQEVVALSKRTRGGLNFASNGSGTSSHLAGVMFAHVSGAALTHIPYKGAAPALNALLSGEVELAFPGVNSVGPLLRAGKVRALARCRHCAVHRPCPICRPSIRSTRGSTSTNGSCCLHRRERPAPSLHG